MIDSFDYKEPSCKLCEGKSFYYPDKDEPIGHVPIKRIIEKLDFALNKNDMTEAGRLLTYWQKEAQDLLDLQGELSIVNELLGYYRKVNKKDKGLSAVERATFLIEKLKSQENLSTATIYLNMATTLKAFDLPNQAIDIYEKAYLIYMKNLQESKPFLSGFYNNLALTLADLSQFDKAEKCYKKALENLKYTDNDLTDGAITYVNMAHLYHQQNLQKKVVDCLFSAYELLNDEKIVKNGYYAYVLSKCAPSFRNFGYEKIADDFEKLSKDIYERS